MSVISATMLISLIFGCYGQESSFSVDIGDSPGGATKTFRITCLGACRDINATIEVDSGNPDLYAEEGKPPKAGMYNVCFKLGVVLN